MKTEQLYSFVMKRNGEVVGGQSQFLLQEEIEKYIKTYKRTYQANEVLVYSFNQVENTLQLQKEISLMEPEECLNCRGTGFFVGIPGEPCPTCS